MDGSQAVQKKGVLNLGLNDGTYMANAAVKVLQDYAHPTGLRNYSAADNLPLRQAIAKVDGVSADHIFVHNGSGPILKQVIPALIKQKILSSPLRILRHLLFKGGCPIISPTLTYEKVPAKAILQGLQVELIEVGPDNHFALDVAELRRRLQKSPGLVYVVNPNNPSGTVTLPRADVERLAGEFPETLFWVDEAYIQYADPALGISVSDLVPRFPNLFVGRTFSFAYGLAAARIGYMIGNPEVVRKQSEPLTDYRVGGLQEALAIASLEDPDHLPFIRKNTAAARDELTRGLERLPGVQVFPSLTNFLLCRLNEGARIRTGAELAEKLAARGIRIKAIAPFGPYRHDAYFRITTGLPDEHARILQDMEELLG